MAQQEVSMKQNHSLPEWHAKWINPELEVSEEKRQPASVMRRRFSLDETGDAFLYITVHGVYEAILNGKRVGDFVLAPGTGDYHSRLSVQCYEVTDLLKEGENELCVSIGDGWYRGSVGIDGLTNYYGKDIALLCQLEVNGKTVLCSDESWEASQSGAIRENDLQKGEVYDARKETITDWHGVKTEEFDYDNLQLTKSVPIIEQERFEGKLIHTPNGETVIDFGQNLAGYTEIRIHAKEGQKIVLHHGETLDENGNFTQSNFNPGDRNQNGGIEQKIEYTCKDGLNVYKPHFTIFGFRYALIETDIDLSDAEFSAVAVYSKMEQTGFFRCGNEDVNRLFMNSLWSMKSNFCDIPTDCPTRERAGWTGDAQVFAHTASMLCDCLPVYRKWLDECRYAQKEDGLVQNIAPVNNSGSMISNMLQGSAGWGDACVIVPWTFYEVYGDESILKENYDMMKGWVDFSAKRAAENTRPQYENNPYKEYLCDQGFHFGEWCQPGVDNTEVMKNTMMNGSPEVATAYFYRSASLLAKIAEILGHEEDAKKYAEIASKAKAAWRFTCLTEGRIVSDRQCDYVRPVAFGLLDEEETKQAVSDLNDLVVRNEYHLNTGFLSTPDLCRVLADYGYADTAYRLLLQKECPGWLYAVEKGATTIWETWDGIREDGSVHDSLNHYSYGAISGWLFDGVCGIRLSSEGLRIHPLADPSLGYAKAVWNSPKGRIASSWKYEENRIVFDITVPMNAVIELPKFKETVEKGTYHYEISL